MSEQAPAALTDWFVNHVRAESGRSPRPPLALALLAGGHSNLTYRVTDADDVSWVLRRPPEGTLLATAHDVLREARVLTALSPTPVPTPAVHAVCEGHDVLDADFFVMEWVDGIPCTTAAAAAGLSPAQRRTAGESLADTLATLHRVDVDAVGLGALGRREGYVQRQLRRWQTQWNTQRVDALTEIDEAFELLSAQIPEQRQTSLVHGDYRLDNCILATDGTVRAVVDWEICALGDPLVDLGVLLAYWTEPGDDAQALEDPPTSVTGFGTRDEVRIRYLQAAGLGPETDVRFYVAFAWWKLACIVGGVAARAAAHGGTGRDAASYVNQLRRIAAQAGTLARAL
ncbi:MAG TPA: phosphotransferase family protein [Jatrophihabitans sp.]|jgi:aminoglycoside phosphotransferase (APT) family kinase protein